MRGLQGKRIVIAGATAGIGAATAERLSQEGASVVIGGRNLDAGQVLAKRLNEAGGKAIAVKFDLADEDSIKALIDTAATEFDGIDGLFTSAPNSPPSTWPGTRTCWRRMWPYGGAPSR
ncbi:SDR family NAD(P)-dependent oxidoreductase [Streptomyces sp. NPDC059010]|uniref:SDR family NAD(P)-dependent oxidoreductase n=1 Tax=Streptomyces sp. NPDC059010 TaxID=3346695 RepID=UPI0036857830